MTPEDAAKIKCDRCGVTIGLYRHSIDWRCPECIWKELQQLILQAKKVIISEEFSKQEYVRFGTTTVEKNYLTDLDDMINKITS